MEANPAQPAEILKLSGIHKTLGGKEILSGVDLALNKGETMVIIGRSGSGKSVTLKNIIGLLRPDKGRILVGGEDITDLPESKYAEVRKRFGVLFQSGALINWMNVRDNVSLPLREHTKLPPAEVAKRVQEKLSLLGLENDGDKVPSEISGGMKKRAGLARAIILDPEIILYDEPTSGLDPVMSNQINELILQMKNVLGVSSIVVTHDMESAYMIGDRIAMLYEGKIIQVGTVEEIKKTSNPIVRQFIEGQTKGPIT